MTIDDILEQAKALTAQERAELARRLLDIPDTAEEETQQAQHWGRSLNELLDEFGPIEMKYPEIEDPVEWVKHLRAEERRRRLGDWGETE